MAAYGQKFALARYDTAPIAIKPLGTGLARESVLCFGNCDKASEPTFTTAGLEQTE